MKTKVVILYIFLAFGATTAFSQEQHKEFFLSDSLIKNTAAASRGYYSIGDNWKYHPGDPVKTGENWADPAFDDKAWENIPETSLQIDSLPLSGWKGVGWFRLHLHVDSALVNQPLVLNLVHFGASDVYIDGKLFYSFGKTGNSTGSEKGFNALAVMPRSILFNKQHYIIAIRYSGFNMLSNRPPILDKMGFSFAIAKPDTVNPALSDAAKFFGPLEALVVGIPLTFALIHILLFVFYQREKSNLYISLFAMTIALWGILEHEAVMNTNAELALFLRRLWIPYWALMPLPGLRFLYSLFYKKLPPQFLVLLIASVVMAIWSWFQVLPWVSLVLFLLSMAEMFRIMIVAMRTKIPGAWIIGAGFAAFGISLLTLIVMTLAGITVSLTLFYIMVYLTGILPVLLSMSVYLSQRVAVTHKNLDAELKKSFQLEMENARKETELKKAGELKEAYDALEVAHQALKSTQAKLIQSEKMASLGELTAGIAHEIQNPLNFVNNFSEVNKELVQEMLQEIEKGNLNEVKNIAKDITENEEKINFHGKRADAIVKGMLQHSRSSNGVKEPTDINALADEYIRLCYHGLRAKDKSFTATIKTDFDASLGKINIIPQDIGRVILNLLTNAFYAVTEKALSAVATPTAAKYEPTVTVSTHSITTEKGRVGVQISVNDNGNGIPQKLLDKIFQPFFTTKPTGKGTGLGLSLSYDIVTKGHGGELTVETAENKGTTFNIRLHN